MNTQPKNKILIIIIGILLIANIVTLSLLLMGKKDQAKPARADKKAQIVAFLKDDVGFTQAQLNQYDTLSKEHRSNMKSLFDDMGAGREGIFKQLSSQSFSDSAVDNAAKAIAEQQNAFEIIMLRHLKDIRNICTPEQRPIFDSGFYKIIAKRGKEKKINSK